MKGQCVANCGACCDPVLSNYGPYDIATAPAWQTELVWMRENTDPLPRGETLVRWRELVGAGDRNVVDRDGMIIQPHFYRCHHFDDETRSCTNYENRPPMCRDYPFYGGTHGDNEVALPKTCGYLVDVGRTPVPVEIGRKR